MKKKYFYYILLFLFNTSILFGQKVTLTPLVVNGRSYTSGPINLESTSTSSVSLNVKVESPTATGNDGTINVYYYKASALGASIATGGNGGSLIFGGGKIANRQFVISLNWNEFATSGGSIYAEYKNATGIIYKSASIAIIKNATSGGGTLTPPADAPNPAKIANTICCNQTVRLGDKPQTITGSQYANPYANYSYGINESWSANGNSTIKFLNFKSIALNIDYISELKNFTITRSLGYNNTSNLTNKSNTITITVVPSPIINKILIEGGKDTNGFVEIIDSNPKQIYSDRASARVNLNILENPYHVPLRGDTFAAIDRYEWQYAITDQNDDFLVKNWITIENENSVFLEYTALTKIPKFEDNYLLIRRIAFYKNLSNASNILKIIPRTLKNNNVICCDQVLAMDSALQQIENPSLITGSSAAIEKTQNVQNINITYQWQSQAITNTRPNQYGTWSNITGATSKDYLPTPLQFIIGTRGGLIVETTYNYRRIATINYRINNKNYTSNSYSNETNVQAGRMYGTPTLIAYPNPASSIIYVENKSTDYLLSSTKISIANIMGTNVSANFSVINENLISIDVSNLVIGTYFINIENTGGGGRRGGRGNSQLTFIKIN